MLEKILDVLGLEMPMRKTEKFIRINKSKGFFEPKTLIELQNLTIIELTDYLMATQDQEFLFDLAYGNDHYWETFSNMDFEEKWNEVKNSIMQMPKDILKFFLTIICI